MVPWRLQLPPLPNGASQRTMAEPSSGLIFFSFPSAKNANQCPSADQNGNEAPSLPSTALALRLPSGRIQISAVPLESMATKANCVPSGEIATEPPLSPIKLSVVPSGGSTNDLRDGRMEFRCGPNSRMKTITDRIPQAAKSCHRVVLLAPPPILRSRLTCHVSGLPLTISSASDTA